jgi:hypothetical protein
MDCATPGGKTEVNAMYAVAERAIQSMRKLPYVFVPALVIGACGISQNDQSIEPDKGRSRAESIAATTQAGQQPDLPTPLPTPVEAPAPAQDLTGGACPAGMLLVEGNFCPNPEQTCVDWMDDPAKFQFARCARYAEPSGCKGARSPMRFCIDRYEAGDESGTPIGDISWTAASAACQAAGKRLCKEQEWLFACEGEEARPYPYGYARNPSICNFEIKDGLATRTGELADHRQPVTANPECLSPFGVQNMVGNIDEWVVLDKPHYSQVNGGRKMMSGLKGGWWGPLRNRCRPTTVDHDEFFHELQTGFRCCADAT